MFIYILSIACLAVGTLTAANSQKNAKIATRNIQKKYKNNLELKHKDILKTSLFIEQKAAREMNKGNFYMPPRKTGTKHAVECDKLSKKCFIILDNKKAYIGEGAFKKVYKAIQYDQKKPKIVARATQIANKGRELALTKKMDGKPGLFTTLGFGTNKKHGKTYQTIYSKLYKPGSLQNALEKKMQFTTYEKIKIAKDILSGLASLHEKGIVHRDLGARNYLIDIPKGKPNKRNISTHIADLGKATYAKGAANTIVQGNTKYTSPEGILKTKMKGNNYYKSDIFAVGCVLHWLYYGKQAPWLNKSYVHDVSGSAIHRFHKLKWEVDHAIQNRRKKLYRLKNPTAKQQFEHLILKMLHTTAKKRSSAKNLSRKINEIFERIHN